MQKEKGKKRGCWREAKPEVQAMENNSLRSGGPGGVQNEIFPFCGTRRHENQLVVTKLGSGIGGKKRAGRNFWTTKLGDRGIPVPSRTTGACARVPTICYQGQWDPAGSPIPTEVFSYSSLSRWRYSVQRHAQRASPSSWSGQRARHVLAARPPERQLRYTNDGVMEKIWIVGYDIKEFAGNAGHR